MAKRKAPTKTSTFKVEFHNPPFVPSSIATNLVVQRFEDSFKVSFYELKPDIILSEEDKNKMEKRGTLRADCVGSFIISPNSLETFVGIMNDQLSKYKQSKEESKT